MQKKEGRNRFGWLDSLLLGIAAVFLMSSVIRVCGTEKIELIRSKAVDFVTGELSAERVLQVIGTWDQPGETTTVFQVTEDSALEGVEREILKGELFPDSVDHMTYLIDFPCKVPAVGMMTSGFGDRVDPISGEQGYHYGIDIAAEEGQPIYAVSSGIVCKTGYNSYGNYVVLEHDDGLQSLYAQCSTVIVSEGERIDAGEQIASIGMTGRATGNHLHFELWRAGKILDPTNYLEL